MYKCWVVPAFASDSCGLAFGAAEGCDKVCFFPTVAEDLGDGARVVMSLHVWFIGAVVNSLAWWSAPDLVRCCVIGRWGRSAKCVAVN